MKYIIVNDGNGSYFPALVHFTKPTPDEDLLLVSYFYPYAWGDTSRFTKRNLNVPKDHIYDSFEEAQDAAEEKLREAIRKRTKLFLERNKFARDLAYSIKNKTAIQDLYN